VLLKINTFAPFAINFAPFAVKRNKPLSTLRSRQERKEITKNIHDTFAPFAVKKNTQAPALFLFYKL